MKNKEQINKKIKGAVVSVVLLLSLLTMIVAPVVSSDFEPQAGIAIVTWRASSYDVEIGDSFNLTLFIDTSGDSTRGLTIRLLLFNQTYLGMANITAKSAIWNTTFVGGWASAPQQDGGKLHNDVGRLR